MKHLSKIVLFVAVFFAISCEKVDVENEGYPIFEISIADMEEEIYFDDDNFLELVLSVAGKDGKLLDERYTMTIEIEAETEPGNCYLGLVDSNGNLVDELHSWEAPLSNVKSSSYNGSGIGSDTKYTKFKIKHNDLEVPQQMHWFNLTLKFEKTGKTYSNPIRLLIWKEQGSESNPRYKYNIARY